MTPFWQDQTVAILASGPSMSQEAADRVRHLPRIAVNNTYMLAPTAQIIYAADAQWWKEHPAALDCPGLKVTIGESHLLTLNNSGKEGFDPNPENIRTGGNSGYQALHIAMHAGAKRILLLGFDMHGSHWHGEHVAPLRNTPSEAFMVWIDRMRGLASVCESKGIEVLNCSPTSALDCFPRMSLETALESCALPA